MSNEPFDNDLRAYLSRRSARLRTVDVHWPHARRAPIAKLVAVGVLVAAAFSGIIVAGFALHLAQRPTSTEPSPVVGSPGTPAARCCAATAYDPATRQVVMFGGLGAHGALGDTWIWNGTGWTRPSLALSPHSRADASMVYDARLGALVLIGGFADAPVGPSERADLAATWLWTATGWQRQDTMHTPMANTLTQSIGGSMAYDASSGRVMLVTTQAETHFQACSTETWTFDGHDWQLAQPDSELPASLAALVNEPQTGHVIAVLSPRPAVVPRGMVTTSCAPGSFAARELPTSTSWRWMGSKWTEVSAGTEPEGAQLAEAADGSFVQLDAVAGSATVRTDNDGMLWSWNGMRWNSIPRPADAPSSISNPQLSVDRFGHILLFGGAAQPNNRLTSDTWIWDGSQWHESTGPPPETSTPSPAAFTPPSKT